MARKRQIERLLLIICEGTKTETQYFKWLSEVIAIPKGIWSKVEVHSSDTIPNDISISKNGELGARKKRQFRSENPNKRNQTKDVLRELWEHVYGTDIDSKKYEDIKAQPLRYVAQAQCIEQDQGVYDELWAVFDKNGHKYHKEAFERAQQKVNGKVTNIAFSNRSFEQWILLHFEKSNRIFEQTECKEGKKSLECNALQGCKGETCLVGYIRKNYLSNYEKSSDNEELTLMMDELIKRHDSAFENANWLRQQYTNSDLPIYERNPYSDVDALIKSLLNL